MLYLSQCMLGHLLFSSKACSKWRRICTRQLSSCTSGLALKAVSQPAKPSHWRYPEVILILPIRWPLRPVSLRRNERWPVSPWLILPSRDIPVGLVLFPVDDRNCSLVHLYIITGEDFTFEFFSYRGLKPSTVFLNQPSSVLSVRPFYPRWRYCCIWR